MNFAYTSGEMITIFEEKICLDYDCVKLLFNEHEVDELIDFLEIFDIY